MEYKGKVSKLYNSYSTFVSKHTRKMLFSWWFIVFCILIIIITTIIALLLDAKAYGITSISDITPLIGLMTSVTFVVAVCGIMGDLMMDRGSKISLPFYIVYIILYGFQCYYWALYYEMLQQLIVLVLVLISLVNWGLKNSKPENEKIKYLDTNKFLYIVLGIIIITIALGSIMEWAINPWIDNNLIYDADGWLDYDLTPWWALRGLDPYPFLDAFVLVAFLGAWMLFTRRYYNAYWIMFMCIIGYFFVYGLMAFEQGYNSYIVYFAVNFVYLFLNQTGMSNWTVLYNEQKELELA